jgi:hypothetical protein
MGKVIMGAVVSLDGFMADDDDGIGPLFDWIGNGDVEWSFPGSPASRGGGHASQQLLDDHAPAHRRKPDAVHRRRRCTGPRARVGWSSPASVDTGGLGGLQVF